MNNRRKLIAIGVGALAAPIELLAQAQSKKVHRIGLLGAETASGQADRLVALRAGLRDFGYVEGRNVVIDYRWAEGKYDRLPELAGELVRFNPDVLVTFGQKAVAAAKRNTTTIPIVIPISSDAIGTGLTTGLARPDGNITGSSQFGPDLMVKRLELLKEIQPRIAQVAVLLNPADSAFRILLQAMENAAKLLKLSVHPVEARSPKEFGDVFAAMASERMDGVVVQTDTLFTSNHRAIAELAAKYRLPAIGGFISFVEAGGLISYGVNVVDLHRRAAYFIDRIFKGAKPADLSIEQATKFELSIDMKAAKALGIAMPPSVMVRATKVIE